jgi:hypothetical protein
MGGGRIVEEEKGKVDMINVYILCSIVVRGRAT